MAITEKIYANATYLIDSATSTVADVSANTINAFSDTSFNSNWDNLKWIPSVLKSAGFTFPVGDSPYAKSHSARFLDAKVYIVSVGASGNGDLPSGRFTGALTTLDSIIPQPLYEFHFSTFKGASDHLLNLQTNTYGDIFGKFSRSASYAISEKKKLAGIQVTVSGGATENVYQSTNYNAHSEMQMQTHAGANKPYIELEWSKIYPSIKNRYPSEGSFINEKSDVTFEWIYNIPASYNGTYAKILNGRFLWRVKDSSEIHTIELGENAKQIVVPENTFPSDSAEIQWKVFLTTEYGTESNDLGWITLSTIDAVPGLPVIIYPLSVDIDNSNPVEFLWRHNIKTGTPQSAADVEYSINAGASWSEIAKVSGPDQFFLVPANYLVTGKAMWRCRTYNTDGVSGPWSQPANIIIRGGVATPTSLYTNQKPFLTVSWNSVNQQGYHLQVLQNAIIIYDSGTVYGVARNQVVPRYLPDGEYTVQVRVTDRQSLWSDWAEITATIVNLPGADVRINVAQTKYGVRVEWSSEHPYDHYFVLRDGQLIARSTGNEFVDETAIGKHHYIVRATDGDGYYTDSAQVVGISSVEFGAIKALQRGKWIVLRWNVDGWPEHSKAEQSNVAFAAYEGREYDVSFKKQPITRTHEFSYAFRSRQDYLSFVDLMQKTVIYKDCWGELAIGALERVNASFAPKYIKCDFEIRESDAERPVDYD